MKKPQILATRFIGSLIAAVSCNVSAADQFQPPLSMYIDLQGIGIAAGDVNGDGRTDIVITGTSGSIAIPDKIYVYLQTATGGLESAVTYFAQGKVGSVSIGDINSDGRSDVVIRSGLGVEVFTQNVSAGLNASVVYPTAYQELTQIGDLNNDGRLDVIGLTSSVDGTSNAADAYVMYQDGVGTLAAAALIPAPHGANDDMQLVDVNNDGLTDVVIMNGFTQPNIAILYQSSAGSLAAPVTFDILPNANTHALAVGDVNGDGRKDIVVTYGGYDTDSYVAVRLQNTDGTFAPATVQATSDATGPVETGDVNNDGLLDVVVLHKDSAGIFLQQQTHTLATEVVYPIPVSYGHFQHGMIVSDINGDGLTDIAFAQNTGPGLVVLYGKTVVTNSPPVANPDQVRIKCPETVVIPVLNNDTDADGDVLQVISVSKPKNGRVTIVANGTEVRYTPHDDRKATDTFSYTISDGKGGTATSNVTITIVKR